ncbi:MAG: hypothetical protein ABI306_02420 [Caulobacteraceae bacterium]
MLAGGAALSLLAGAAVAQLGLRPVNAVYAQYDARADSLALAQTTVPAYAPPTSQAATYDYNGAVDSRDPQPKLVRVSDESSASDGDVDAATPRDLGEDRTSDPRAVALSDDLNAAVGQPDPQPADNGSGLPAVAFVAAPADPR